MKNGIVSKLPVIVFLVVFIIIGAFMVKGLLTQQKENEADNARYEQMIHEGEKTQLTQTILDEDHDEYVARTKSGNKTFAAIGIAFLSLMVIMLIVFIVKLIISKNQGATGLELTRNIIAVVALLIFTGIAVFVGFAFIRPAMNNDKYETESYKFVELNIATTQVEEIEHRTKTNGHTRTTKTYNYYLITDDDQKISVSKNNYDRFNTPGVYYAGRTESGAVFSLYPSTYFELA